MPQSRIDRLLGEAEEAPAEAAAPAAAPVASSRIDRLLSTPAKGLPPPPRIDRMVKLPKEKIYSGGAVRDIFDFMGTVLGTYPATAGVVALTKGQNPVKAAGSTLLAGFGVGEADRPSYEEALEELGMKPGAVRTGVGLALDIVVDPAWIVTPAAILGKMNKIKAVGEFTSALKKGAESTKVGKLAARNLVFPIDRAGVPAKAVEGYDALRLSTSTVARRAEQLGKDIAKESHAMRNFLTEMAEAATPAERAVIKAAARPLGVDGKKLTDLFDEAVVLRGDLILRSAVAVGSNTASVAKQFQQGLTEIIKKRAQLLNFTKLGAGRPPKAFEKMLDGITQEGFSVAHAVSSAAGRVSKLEYFSELAPFASAVETATQTVRISRNKAVFGDLAGKWLPEALGDMTNLLTRDPTKWEKAIGQTLGFWKMGKTILNPSSGPRQFFGNMLISTVTGPMPVHRLLDTMYKGARALRGHGEPALLEAVDLIRLRGGSFAEAELRKFTTGVMQGSSRGLFSTLKKAAALPLEKASNLYQFWDRWAKAGMASYAIGKGASPKAAAALAEATLFDYARVPRAVEFMRSQGIVPFASFSYFATRASAKALWSRPAALGQVHKAMAAVERTNPDLAELKRQLPPWMKEMGQVVTPLKDAHGRKLLWSAAYLLPFQNVIGVAEGGKLPGPLSIPQQLAGNIPLATLWSEVTTNRSVFTGREIVPAAKLVGSTEEKFRTAGRHVIDYVYKLALPTWAPSIVPGQHPSRQLTTGGPMAKNIEDFIKERPDFYGKSKGTRADWWQLVMAEGFGFRTRPIDIEGERKRRANEYKDRQRYVTTRMHRVWEDTKLSPEERGMLIEDLQKDLIGVHQDWVLSQGGDADED